LGANSAVSVLALLVLEQALFVVNCCSSFSTTATELQTQRMRFNVSTLGGCASLTDHVTWPERAIKSSTVTGQPNTNTVNNQLSTAMEAKK